MAFPVYRQDFEGGSTLATACPELSDITAAPPGWAIDTTSKGFTGTNSLSANPGSAASSKIASTANDTLNGNISLSAYVRSINTGIGHEYRFFARAKTTALADAYFADITNAGLQVFALTAGSTSYNIGGGDTNMQPLVTNIPVLMQFWLTGTSSVAVKACLVRQDNGQYWTNAAGGSWTSTPTYITGTDTSPPNTGAGLIAIVHQTANTGGTLETANYTDDLIYEPSTQQVDIPTVTLTGTGATQQLTAGGFTDPLYGVTWGSSNTGVATVSATGLVTSVAVGTCTITATGKRDTGQTATSAITVTTAAATSYTLTGPSSGKLGTASTNFTVSPNGTFTGTITITPSGGGLSTPIVLTFSGPSTPQNFTITPTAGGAVTLTPTNSGTLSNPANLTYTVLASTYTLTGPTTGVVNVASTNFTVTPNASYTGTITITPSGGGLSTPIVLTFSGSATPQTFAITPTAIGAVTLTPTNNQTLANPANLTYSSTAALASSYTLTGPASGYANNASANFTVTPNGPYTGTVTVTPSGGGLSSPTVLTFSGSATPQTFAITPTAAGAVTLTPTNSGTLSNAGALTYTATAQGLAVAPSTYVVSTAATATFTGTGTLWTHGAPTITATGPGSAGLTIGAVTVTTDTSCTALVTPGTSQGAVTFTDSTTGATASGTVGPFVATTGYLASVTGFASGLVGTVGYTVLDSTGAAQGAHTTAGIWAVGASGGYASLVQIPTSGQYIVLWDDGSGHQAFETTPDPRLANLDAAISSRSIYAGGPVASVTDRTGFSLAATGLDLIPAIDPGGVATTFPQMMVQLWRRWFKRSVKSVSGLTIKTYADDGTTVRTTQTYTDDGAGNQSQGPAS